MAYLIGMDEAGYGPNLGPLVVSASVWRISDALVDTNWYDTLGDAIAERPSGSDRRVAIADSKMLYQPGGGLANLERGLFVSLTSLGARVITWQSVWHALAADEDYRRNELPWYQGYDCQLPIDCDSSTIDDDAASLRDGLAAHDVELMGLASRAVFPPQFNEMVAKFDSKAEALSRTTLDLANDLLVSIDDGPIYVVCDKHGGRSRYSEMLQRQWPDVLVEIRAESRQESIYRFGPDKRRVEFRFRAKGDRFVPAALASMASKYLRELAMKAFNEFWCTRIDGLRPTAGYPVDAKRFHAQIAPLVDELEIAGEMLWRCR